MTIPVYNISIPADTYEGDRQKRTTATSQTFMLSPTMDTGANMPLTYGLQPDIDVEALLDELEGISADWGATKQTKPELTKSLKTRQQEAIRFAQEYRAKYGDPVNNLSKLLSQVIENEELWQSILDEPYG
jgi:hypothetical protein